ncbi:hypothetical protein ACJX0J_005969, partial [Zea mays]
FEYVVFVSLLVMLNLYLLVTCAILRSAYLLVAELITSRSDLCVSCLCHHIDGAFHFDFLLAANWVDNGMYLHSWKATLYMMHVGLGSTCGILFYHTFLWARHMNLENTPILL